MTICIHCNYCSKESVYYMKDAETYLCKMPTKIDFVTGIQQFASINCYSKNTTGECKDFRNYGL